MKEILSLSLTFLLVCSTLSVLTSMQTVSAVANQYFIYSKFDPPGIGDVTGVGGYVEYFGVPEYGDEIQYVYFLSGYTGYKMKVWTTDGDGDGKIEPRQHPNHYIAGFVGPVEPRHFEIVSSAYLDGRTYGSGGHSEEFYVDSSGVYLGAYPYGINKWDHNWNYIGKIANSPPERTESMAYNPSENIWYAGGRYRTIYQLKDTDKDGSFLDESWQAILTYPSYSGDHHDGMEYVGGYLWISDMTSDVIGKWQFDPATSTWQELARFTYTEAADVEGMGFGPNDHFWVGSGWGSGSYIYELGNEITKGYPIADAGDDVDSHPPIIPVKFDSSESHHTDPTKNIVLYEWDFESDGIWDFSSSSLMLPTGLSPTAPGGKRFYGYDGACTYYDYAGWLARGDRDWNNDGIKDYASGCYHIAQDIQASVGDDVYAIADGVVTSISGPGYSHGWDKNPGDNNLGIVVQHKLSDGSEFLALYGHVHSSVSIGHHLKTGEAFATIGPYGSEPHLHFGIHPGLSMPGTNWGLMPLTSWSDPDAHPGELKGPDTNGFVDPMEWMAAKAPYTLVSLVEHSYPAYYSPDGSIDWSKTAKDYTASLRVTDDSDPALRDTDTRIVHITAPPWKPVANPDGPYYGYKGVAVQLDGSESYDPESKMFPTDHPWYETIETYEWDLDHDGQFDDATGTMPTYTWNTEGLHIIGLKVTDSQPSGVGSTVGPLDIDTRYTTAIITETQPPIGDLAEETVSNYIQSADVNGNGQPDFRWNSGYDISFVSQTLNIEINIQLVGDDPGDALRQQWHDGIEGIWSNAYDIVDGSYTYPIEVSVNWVNTNPHHAVTVHDMLATIPDHWINMLNWYTQVPDAADYQDEIAAHEAGHMLGVYDEYAAGALDPDTLLVTTNSLMADLGPTWERHYQQILQWLETRSGRDLSLAQSPLPPYPRDNPIPDFTDPMDNIPPATTLDIGEPKYIDPMDNIYVSSATPFTLTAEDNPGGTGVASTFYHIHNSSYDTSWVEYSVPFYLTGLTDGEYSIDYYSTDNAGNFENTSNLNATLVGPDINGDGKADMKDIVIAINAFRSFPGHPRWNPIADINFDGLVDMRDIVYIAMMFGKHWP